MSDYTPDGMSDSEPSMEDILASIRKIIADDSSKPEAPSPAPAILTAVPSQSAAGDAPDTDILDLADDGFAEFLSDDLTEAPSSAAPEHAGAVDDILDLTQSLPVTNDDLSFDDDTDFDADFDLVLDDDDSEDMIALKAGVAVSAVSGAAALAVSSDASDDDVLSEIDDLSASDFTDTEFDLDIPAEAERVIDPAADLLFDDDGEDEADIEGLMSDLMPQADAADDASVSVLDVQDAAELSEDPAAEAGFNTAGDADIDLVKSLMAELTEDDDGFTDLPLSGDADVSDETMAETTAASDEADDDFDFDDLLAESDDAPGETTGIAASAADDIAPQDIGDDLASIVAQSSADIEAAKSDAEALQDTQTLQEDDETFDLAALIEDGEAEEQPDAADASPPGVISAAIAGASVLGVSAAALARSSDDDDSDSADDDFVEAIDNAAESAHEFDDVSDLNPSESELADELLLAEDHKAATAADPTPKEDTDMPRIVKSDSIATEETVEAASGAFASLSQVVEEKAVYNESGPRIGDLVQEALKPMLQDWLDKNLKGIVDRAVAKEIKRISSGK